MKTKRKIQLDDDVCCVERCNRKTDLFKTFVNHRGDYVSAPMCSKHIDEFPRAAHPSAVDVVEAIEVRPEEEEPKELVLRTTEPDVATETAEIAEVLNLISNFSIVDPDDEIFATSAATSARDRNRELEEEKLSATRPIMSGLEKIRSWFKPRQEAYSAIERAFKDSILKYRQRLEAERAAAFVELEEAEPEEVPAFLATIAAAQAPETQGMSLPVTWDFEIIDQSAVPEEYKTVWTPTVRKAIAGKNGLREIPGLRIFSKATVRLG